MIMRKRFCNNPVVFGPGKDCVGNDTDFKICSKGACSGKYYELNCFLINQEQSFAEVP